MALKNVQYELKLSDAFQLVSANILINKMSVENLQLQSEYIQLQIDLQYMAKEIARQKIELIHKLNEVLESQLNEYCEIRQEACQLIIEDINALDICSEEYRNKVKTVQMIHDKMSGILDKIEGIRSSIPSTITVTNYRVRPRSDINSKLDLDPMV